MPWSDHERRAAHVQAQRNRRDLGMSPTAPQRFWERVDKTGECWLWTGAILQSGYGTFGPRSYLNVVAHRVSWEMAYGPIPDGLQVLHRCDVRRCVRPDHLFLGTQADNMRDMAAKGRGAVGERHGRHKLTAAQVVEIRERWANGEAGIPLAAAFGVSLAGISLIVRGRKWPDAGGPIAGLRRRTA